MTHSPLNEESLALIADFQKMIDSGIVWNLEPIYGAFAEFLIKEGYCTGDINYENT